MEVLWAGDYAHESRCAGWGGLCEDPDYWAGFTFHDARPWLRTHTAYAVYLQRVTA